MNPQTDGDYQTLISLMLSAGTSAVTSIATVFYWGGGTRAKLEALEKGQVEMLADLRQIRGFLMDLRLREEESAFKK